MEPKKVFQEIKELTEPLIERYMDDLLIHDKKSIEGNTKNVPFLHFTRKSGTFLFFLKSADEYPAKNIQIKHLFGTADRNFLLNEVLESVKWCQNMNTDLILYYDSTKINKIDQDKAEEIAKEYVNDIKTKWGMEKTFV